MRGSVEVVTHLFERIHILVEAIAETRVLSAEETDGKNYFFTVFAAEFEKVGIVRFQIVDVETFYLRYGVESVIVFLLVEIYFGKKSVGCAAGNTTLFYRVYLQQRSGISEVFLDLSIDTLYRAERYVDGFGRFLRQEFQGYFAIDIP